MNDLPIYELERTFAAPRHLVWRTWTEPEFLARWYGPNVETINHRLDLKPGGLWLVEMRMKGRSSFQKAEYLEVAKPEKLVWLHANTDAELERRAEPHDAGLAASAPHHRHLLRGRRKTRTSASPGSRTRRPKPRSPASGAPSPTWAPAGTPAWRSWRSSWPNCRNSVGRGCACVPARACPQPRSRIVLYIGCSPG